MCKCNPNIRTPFCGKPGCEWPKQKPPKKRENVLTDIDLSALIDCYERNPGLPLFRDAVITCLRELQDFRTGEKEYGAET